MLTRKQWELPMSQSTQLADLHRELIEQGWYVQHIYIRDSGEERSIILEGLRNEAN